MNAKLEKQAETIFYQAIEKNPADRESFLKEICGDNNELYNRVNILLKAYDTDDSLHHVPLMDSQVTLDAPSNLEGPGTVIDKYKLLEKIGEGGMAVVYMAEQEKPIRRKVALKIIKLGMDTKSVIARFEAERQALAMMDHPNIAKVLDAGATETGRPYFVMELVTGVSITEYCDKNNLSTRERLALFIEVCNAIQHAHQKGIIHRDIKPSNVMVTQRDSTPIPKIIDFGIAKAINQRLTEKTLFTRYAHIIGTPAYMSPEQAELSDLDIDTRTDIYSLGVLLYELLTGTPPFSEEELHKAGYLEMQRIIREDDPDKPSTKLSTMGEALTDVAKHRRVSPDLLPKLVRGDLDWIVMKTLEKDRTRRYETASELATDIERHLVDELVLAGPPGTGYRLRKFIRRNRVGVLTGLLVTASLLAVAVISAIYASEAIKHANESEDARQEITSLLAGSYVDRAQALCEQGEVGRGMLWLADSLKIASDDSSDLNRAVRTSLAAWHGQLHSLRAVVQYPDQINAVTFNPDGSWTLAACEDGTARIFDSTTGQLTGKPLLHDSAVFAVAISPNGKRIATGDKNGLVRLWDAMTFEPIGELMQFDKRPHVAFSHDSKRLMVGSTVGDARFCDADTGTLLGKAFHFVSGDFWIDGARVYEGDYVASDSNIPSPGNVTVNMLANGGFEAGTLEPWTTYGNITAEVVGGLDGAAIPEAVIEGSSCLHIVDPGANMNYWDAGLSHTGHHLKAGKKYTLSVFLKSKAGALNINIKSELAVAPWTGLGNEIITITDKWAEYSLTTPVLPEDFGPVSVTFNYVPRDVRAMAYCPDGFRVVSEIDPHTYQMFDADCGEPLGPPVESIPEATAVAISPDGKRFATAKHHCLIQVWDVATGKLVFEPILHGGIVVDLAFSPDGSLIVSGGNTRMALLWDAATGEPIGAPLRQRNTVCSVAFSPDGKRVVTGNQDGVLRIWDIIHRKYVGEPAKHESRILVAAYGPDGLRILTETGSAVQVRDATTGRPIGKPLSGLEEIDQMAFSPDGWRLAVKESVVANIKLWDIATGQLVGESSQRVVSTAFSPDGSRVLAGTLGGVAWLWDAATMKCLGKLHQQRGVVSSVAFTADGSRLLTGSYDGITQLWDAATLEPIGRLPVHQSEVKSAVFSPDGSNILIGFADGTVRLWDAGTLKPIGTPLQQLKIVCEVAFSPDGSRLLACSIDRTARLWDTATLKPIGPPLEHNGWWPWASFSPDGSEILVADKFGSAEVWQAPLGPLAGDYEQIACWVQVVTGMELDATGGINVLDASEWQKRYRRLQELGGPPDLTSRGL